MIIPETIEFSDNKNFNLNTDNEHKKVYAKNKKQEMSYMYICLMTQSSK